jgi:hypothetical protein
MHLRFLKQTVVACALLACAGVAMAQYVWLNDKGVKQYSDMPPPASVPNSKILKTPNGVTHADTSASSDDSDGDAAKKTAPQTTADKNAEFQKRRAEQAEKDKKAEDKAKQDALKQKNCERARDYQRALESGQRISRVNASGEREFLNDEQRAKEQSDAQRAVAECNK